MSVCSSPEPSPPNSMRVRRKGSRSLRGGPGGGSPPAPGSGICPPQRGLPLSSQYVRAVVAARRQSHTHALQVNEPIQELPASGGEAGHRRPGRAGTNRCPWSLHPAPILRQYRAVSGARSRSVLPLLLLTLFWSKAKNPVSAPQPAISTTCKSNTFFLWRVAWDKGQSEQDEMHSHMPECKSLVFKLIASTSKATRPLL